MQNIRFLTFQFGTLSPLDVSGVWLDSRKSISVLLPTSLTSAAIGSRRHRLFDTSDSKKKSPSIGVTVSNLASLTGVNFLSLLRSINIVHLNIAPAKIERETCEFLAIHKDKFDRRRFVRRACNQSILDEPWTNIWPGSRLPILNFWNLFLAGVPVAGALVNQKFRLNSYCSPRLLEKQF